MICAETPTLSELVTPNTENETIIEYQSLQTDHNSNGWRSNHWIPNKKDYYKHLDLVNNGVKNGSLFNTPYIIWELNNHLIASLASQLELTDRQTTRAKNYFLSLDLSEWGVRAELVAWGVCACVVHTDDGDVRDFHPRVAEEEMDDNFRRVTQSLGFTTRELHSIYGKVAHRWTN